MASKQIHVLRVVTKDNVSDLLTKPVTNTVYEHLIQRFLGISPCLSISNDSMSTETVSSLYDWYIHSSYYMSLSHLSGFLPRCTYVHIDHWSWLYAILFIGYSPVSCANAFPMSDVGSRCPYKEISDQTSRWSFDPILNTDIQSVYWFIMHASGMVCLSWPEHSRSPLISSSTQALVVRNTKCFRILS